MHSKPFSGIFWGGAPKSHDAAIVVPTIIKGGAKNVTSRTMSTTPYALHLNYICHALIAKHTGRSDLNSNNNILTIVLIIRN